MKYIQNVGWIYPPYSLPTVDKSTLRVISIILLFTFVQAHAGLTDFKTIEQATEAYNAKEYTKSVTLLEGLKKSNATNELHYNLGNTYYRKGYYEKAIEEYQTSKGVDEASRQYNLGNSYFKNSELDKSIESFKKSLKLKDDPKTRHNLEIAEKEKQKKEEEKKQQKKDKQEDKKNDKDKKEKKQNKEDENKKDNKKEDENKEVDKKESDSKKEKKSLDKKDNKNSTKSKEQKKMSKEDKLKEQELKRLMKKMQKGKTPTMMYQMGESKKGQRSDDAKPW